MIRPKHGTDAFRALALIVETPGELSSDALAAHLWPPVTRSTPFASAAEYSEWRRNRVSSERDRAAKASRIVRRLAEAGLIESRGGPTLAAWFRDKWERRAIRIVADWRALGMARSPTADEAREIALTLLVGAAEAGLIRQVAKGPETVGALLGPSPSGARKRLYAGLVAQGVVVAPAQRWPTAAGVELVTNGGAQ
jgi:hypothetical protein